MYIDDGMITSETIVKPVEITREQLLEFHTERYINSLGVSSHSSSGLCNCSR